MKKIYLATTNPGKLKEISEILGIPLVAANIEIDEVQSMDLEYVSRKKAEAAFEKLKKPVIVDDVGFYVESWNNFPGPFIKHMFDALGESGFLKLILKEGNKKVRVAAVIGFHDGKKVHTFLGEFYGKVSDFPKGNNSFGFDSIVIPDGYDITYAEMSSQVKNKMSHRSRALVKFKKFLDSQK